METSLLLLILGFVVVAFLIIKFIKKVVVAVVSILLLFVLLVGSVVGLVVLDLNQLMENKSYDLQVVYSQDSEYSLGIEIPVENKEPAFENISSMSEFNLNNLNVEDISKDDNIIVIVVTDDTFEKLIIKDSYDLSKIQGIDAAKLDGVNLNLTKSEVLSIVNSNDGIKTLIDILFLNNDIKGPAAEILSPAIESEIRNGLKDAGISFREAMFVYVIGDSVESNEGVVTLLSDYKGDGVDVYPDRLSFKVLRMLPVDTVKGWFFEDSK